MIWLIIAGVTIALICAVALSLVWDAFSRSTQEIFTRTIDVVQLSNSGAKEVLVVYLPGVSANPTMVPETLINTWSKAGRVWGVHYTSPRFRPEMVSFFIASWILRSCKHNTEVRRVVLIGSSMGGLLAYDVQQQLRLDNVDIDLILVDAPTGPEDLHFPGNIGISLMRLLPFGPIWNKLHGPIMKRLFVQPMEDEIDKGVNREWLDEYVRQGRTCPPSRWRDQAMYILNHEAPKADSIDASFIYIRSTKDDDTVRPEAADKWRQAVSSKSPRSFMLDAEGAKHAAYAQNPHAYEEVFPVAFGLLGV